MASFLYFANCSQKRYLQMYIQMLLQYQAREIKERSTL